MNSSNEVLVPLLKEIIFQRVPASVAFHKIQNNDWLLRQVDSVWVLDEGSKLQKSIPAQQLPTAPLDELQLQLLLKQANPILVQEFIRLRQENLEAKMIISLYENQEQQSAQREH